MTLDDKPAFSEAIGTLALALREPKQDAAQMWIYFDALKSLDIEFVVSAATVLQAHAEWFPKPKEWRDAALKIEKDRTDALTAVIRKRQLSGLGPLCGECDDTGWYLSTTQNRYKRCACRDLRRLEVLGRRPMPLLPEASEAVSVIDVGAVTKALASTKGMR